MKPADCYVGQQVQVGQGGTIRVVESISGDWAELRDPATGARSGTRIQHLDPVRPDEYPPPALVPTPIAGDPTPTWQERVWAEALRSEPVPEPAPARLPSLLCWGAILIATAFVALHVWGAIRFARGTAGLDSTGAAVAIGTSGVGWTAWFVTMLWMAWRRRR